jgi:hypothetical protein
MIELYIRKYYPILCRFGTKLKSLRSVSEKKTRSSLRSKKCTKIYTQPIYKGKWLKNQTQRWWCLTLSIMCRISEKQFKEFRRKKWTMNRNMPRLRSRD